MPRTGRGGIAGCGWGWRGHGHVMTEDKETKRFSIKKPTMDLLYNGTVATVPRHTCRHMPATYFWHKNLIRDWHYALPTIINQDSESQSCYYLPAGATWQGAALVNCCKRSAHYGTRAAAVECLELGDSRCCGDIRGGKRPLT